MKKCKCTIHKELYNLVKHNEKIATELLRLIDHLNRQMSHMEIRHEKIDV
ncbi:MAG TPA: hypothetical protein VK056_02745 [Bacillota bacterium]|nr:hypothetical protein [Bacillota bacterium]